jgi:hypothetical protein
MKFYTDIEAVLGVWDGKKIIEIHGEIETTDKDLIKLLKKAGLRHDDEGQPEDGRPSKVKEGAK